MSKSCNKQILNACIININNNLEKKIYYTELYDKIKYMTWIIALEWSILLPLMQQK